MMKRLLASAALATALTASALPALAKNFVQDNAQVFSSATVDQLNARISNFNRDTGKEVVVVTVPSVTGGDVRTAAENAFAQQSVNGVLIFVDKNDRRDYVIPDNAAVQAGWWSSQTSASVIAAMGSSFRAGDFDGGITNAVSAVFDVYRSHAGSLSGARTPARSYAQQTQSGGVHISVFWWIIIALFAFFIIRTLIRASRGTYYGGGYGAQGPGYGPGQGYGPGFGGYGYGGGWGGGGFWSGLLGGLGGAWLGNELFGGRGWGGGMQSGVDPGAQQAPADGGGWQADPGQAGMSGGAGGDWGGGGWGDIGGGGGDMGGGFGGGDAGGGW